MLYNIYRWGCWCSHPPHLCLFPRFAHAPSLPLTAVFFRCARHVGYAPAGHSGDAAITSAALGMLATPCRALRGRSHHFRCARHVGYALFCYTHVRGNVKLS